MLLVPFFIVFTVAFYLSRKTLGSRNDVVGEAVRSEKDFPYLCSVHCNESFVGACSILTDVVVIVSMSNMNKPRNVGVSRRYYSQLSYVKVIAGSVNINPVTEGRDAYPGAVSREVESLFMIPNYADLNDPRRRGSYIEQLPGDTGQYRVLDEVLEYDIIDVAFNVGFLKLTEPFIWTASVSPMRVDLTAVPTTDSLVSVFERKMDRRPNCKIAAWNELTGRMILHHVMYIPKDLCRQAYCDYKLKACNFFLVDDQDYHVCFKSAYWGEPCPNSTGAALYCQSFGGGSIFGILTTTVDCGTKNLPCVYTTMPSVLKAYKDIWRQDYLPPIKF